jgi:hypothetical protein
VFVVDVLATLEVGNFGGESPRLNPPLNPVEALVLEVELLVEGTVLSHQLALPFVVLSIMLDFSVCGRVVKASRRLSQCVELLRGPIE